MNEKEPRYFRLGSFLFVLHVFFFVRVQQLKLRPLGAENRSSDFPGLNSGACSRVYDIRRVK